MLRMALFLAFLASALAQKKPITLAALAEADDSAKKQDGPAIWAPDGKSFAFQRARTILIYDPASKKSRELVSAEAMEAAAVPQNREGPFEWTNRRAAPDSGLQWSGSGKELLYETCERSVSGGPGNREMDPDYQDSGNRARPQVFAGWKNG